MLNNLSPTEKQLTELMSEISERCYSAGWMEGLEYVLWDAVISGPRHYGREMITQEDINQLIQLSRKANAWIVFDDEQDQLAIPLDTWNILFAEDIKQNRNLI